MTRFKFRSLQSNLIVPLASLYIVATALILGLLVYRAQETANSLNDRELSYRAEDLARSVWADVSGSLHVEIPPKLSAAYMKAADNDVFAIRAPNGRVLAASPASFGSRVADWPVESRPTTYFRLGDPGTPAKHYYGLNSTVSSAAGPITITVARAATSNALVTSWMRAFFSDIAWLIALMMLGTLAIGRFVVRRGLGSVRAISQMAEAIGPGSTAVRLPEDDVPSEIAPLVSAVNRALQRLDHGFEAQRQFTANAAHELRTPLAIVTCAIDAMESTADVVKLRGDVTRMNRLVEQLLRVSRLDSIALDTSNTIDIGSIATSVVTMMAPWAISQKRFISLAMPDHPVHVLGNTGAIEDALRNLVENAVFHSPPGAEVTISVHDDGSLNVIDTGPGVSVEDRTHVFKRFWRGNHRVSDGAGLGLAIVADTMKLHGGTAVVADNPRGGAVFTLRFPGDRFAN